MIKYSKKWWLDVGDRSWRQSRQVAVPVLVVIATGNAAGVDLPGTLLAIVAAALWVALRAVTEMRVGLNAPPLVQVIDRAVSAAVGALLGLLTVVLQAAAGGSWPGFMDAVERLDVHAVILAGLGAGFLAVIDARSVPTLVESPDEALPAIAYP